MRVLDLFSGIGGFSLGLESVGMETAAFCEMDSFCQKVLKKNWPDVPIHSDIKELDGHEYRGAVELICGGFPCQPFSIASTKRLGKEDDRALWPEMYRVIQEVQPTWVIAENVPGIINMELDQVLSDLEDSCYSSQTLVLPACSVDAPHRRERVWIIAYCDMADSGCESERIQSNRFGGERIDSSKEEQRSKKGNGFTDSSQIMANPDSQPIWRGRLYGESCNERWETSATGRESVQPEIGQAHIYQSESSGQDVADTDTTWEQQQKGHQQKGRRWIRDGSQEGVALWESEPGVGRVADGVPNRTHRLRGLGNAVVPQLVAEIGRIVMYHHENNIDPRG